MKTRMVRISLLCLLLPVTPLVSAELEPRLPEETLLYAKWSGRSLTFDGSRFGQLLLDPQVEELMGFFRAMVRENVPDETGRQIVDHLWSAAGLAWQHPSAAAVYDITPQGVSAVLLIDLGQDRPAVQNELDTVLSLTSGPEGRERTTVQVGPNKYTLLSGKEKGRELALGYIGDLFFLTVGPGQAKALLERTVSQSLAVNEKFAACMQAVGGDNLQIALYVDVERIVSQVEAIASPEKATTAPQTSPAMSEIRLTADALGLGNLQALAGAVRVVDKNLYTKIRLFTPAPHRGLLLGLAGAPLTEADLASVPDDADLVVAVNASPAAMHLELCRMLKQIDPRAEMALDEILAAGQKALDLDIQTDLLEPLGDTWVFSVAPSQGGPIVGSMLSVDVKDETALRATLAKLEALVPSPATQPTTQPTSRPRSRPVAARIQTRKVGDTEIHYLRTVAPGKGMIFLPAWAIHNGRVYLALWPQVIASALENPTSPLTASEAFQAQRSRLAPNGSALVYVNTPQILQKLYPLFLIGGTALMNHLAYQARTATPVPLLPGSLNDILRHITPQISVISHDEQGITFEGYGAVPSILPGLPVLVGTGAAVLLPALK